MGTKDPNDTLGRSLSTSVRGTLSADDDINPPPRLTPPPSSNLYAGLSSFSFGAAPSSRPPPPSVDPLSTEDDHDPPQVDITPRPSVVEYGTFGGYVGSKTTPPISLDHQDGFSPDPHRASTSDAASHRTFGTSSASASVTSLSSVGHHDSRLSERSSSTRHTSAANTDEEDEPRNLDFSSDDEYYDEEYDDHENDDPAYHVEINSAIYHENSPTGSPPWTSGYSRTDLSYDRRRGSLPMAIPGAPLEGRDIVREDSLIYHRRPSRSLDDDLPFLTASASGATPGSSLNPLGSSVPGSSSEWQRRLSSGRGSVSTVSTIRDGQYSNIIQTSSRANPSTVTDGFDQDWFKSLSGGITHMSSSANDFINPNLQSARKASILGRRSSLASSVSTFDDTFLKAVGRWDSQGYGVQRREWTFKRETVDGSGPSAYKPTSTGSKLAGLLGAGKSSVVERDRVGLSSVASAKSMSPEEREKRERDKERERRLPENWRGMAIGAGEVWCNNLIGRYQINRTTSTPSDSSKGPQQRLNINQFFDDRTKIQHRSPPVTVHKHSKAVAYSISRFYKIKLAPPTDAPTTFKATASRDSRQPKPPPSRDGSVITSKTSMSATYSRPRGSTTMILLAPRRVQEDYTNTTTTRRLESHGLLDEHARSHREQSLTRSEQQRDKEKKQKREDSKKTKKDKSDRDQISSSGSVTSTSSHLAPSATALLAPERARRRRRSIVDDESDEEAVIHRTPHSETYSTIDPSLIQQLRPTRTHPGHDESGFIRRMWRVGSKTRTAPDGSNFNPPWMVMSTRKDQEAQEQMVKNLNNSFAGVGLLPPTDKGRTRTNSQKQKRREHPSIDIFEDMDLDTLFMVLPMWPGETDPKSRNKMYQRPDIPSDDRLFLILSYHANSKAGGNDKKKVRSPTSSADHRDERNVLFSCFHISARVVRYAELMGSGIRVPDEGLAVSGPLQEAYMYMPNQNIGKQVIGNCNSRESGVEFDPEGLQVLGLCRRHQDGEGNDEIVPTPMGRAVIEIAFIGGIALTSFGSITS